MIFTYKLWEEFCRNLDMQGIHSIPANEIQGDLSPYLVLKHDVETDVSKAYVLAKIEQKFHHRGSYYIQAYLMQDESNLSILKEMRDMGHEISYHYDVMDSNHGDIDNAVIEFEANKNIFEKYGFQLKTVCQHGNPVVERVGYTSNRDFFRNQSVRDMYSDISDIMVNFKEAHNTDYTYYSDAGRKFKMIFDPINNDIINSDDKNIEYKDLNALLRGGQIGKGNCIISTHPHRWTKSAVVYSLKGVVFKIIKAAAKIMMKIPFMKKFMSKYYYLAKKI